MNFNIETYLNSLSEDIQKINVSDKDINYLPDLRRFKKLKILNCNNNKLTSLPHFNEKLEKIYCCHNQLSSLPLLNENLKELYCSHNQLTSLPQFNKKLEQLNCSNNQITSLPHFNEKLEKIYCSYNQLSFLPHLNKKLKILYCRNNKLNSLPYFNEELEDLYYDDNPIWKIIKNDNLSILKIKIQLLNNFCYLYYCLKFKKKFRDLLWVKIREPKIKERYSHDYLVKHLHEDTDLDEFLNNW